MTSAPHLLIEDRPEFERILDEVLSTAHDRPELAVLGRRISDEQLRTMALGAASSIAAAAAEEYQRFVALREELRRPARSSAARGRLGSDPGGSAAGGGGAPGGSGDQGGAGLGAVFTVLTPVLAGTAAVIFLAFGYLLHLVSPEPSLAAPMRTAGWVFAALAAAGILIASAGLLVTAVRNGARASRANGPRGDALAAQVAQARDAWREALLNRGILPYLRQVVADATTDSTADATAAPVVPHQPDTDRTPHLGYSRPGFSSPAADEPGESGSRPRYSSPKYSSPHYGGPEHQPE